MMFPGAQGIFSSQLSLPEALGFIAHRQSDPRGIAPCQMPGHHPAECIPMALSIPVAYLYVARTT